MEGVRGLRGPLAGSPLDIPTTDDINTLIHKLEKLPDAIAAIPGIQANTTYIQQSIPVIVGAVLILAIAVITR